MNEFIQFAVLGLGIAAIYSLLASGIVLIYRGSGVVNFAHGAFALIGALVYVELDDLGAPAIVCVLGATAAGAMVGFLVQVLLMRPLRNAAPLVKVIATLGVLLTVQTGATLFYGDRGTIIVDHYLPNDIWVLFDVNIQSNRIILLAIAAVITVLLTIGQSRTRIGLAMRAAAENEVAAGTLGWSPNRLGIASWAIGGGLAGLAGALMAPITSVVIAQMTLLVVPALAAALLGRFNSFSLALAGAVAIGVGQSLIIRYVDQPGAAEAFPFLVIIVVLVVTGQSLPLRSHLTARLPSVGNGRIRWWIVLIAVVIGVVLVMFVFNAQWLDAVTASLSGALILLSVVVITGYAGQISLAQYALAGLGAFVAGRLVASTGIPFPLAMLIGVAAAVPIGALFAIPALRTRGVNLAVITLGLAVAVFALVFNNIDYTGGSDGTSIGERSIFGISFDAVTHPERYALLVLVLFVGAAILVANLRRGAPGRRLIAIRGNERAAASLGISVSRTKTYAFIVAAALAALGGILIGFRSESIVYPVFEPLQSIIVIAFAVIGGVGYVLGPVFAAPLVPGGIGSLAEGLIPGLAEYLPLIGSVSVLIVVLTNPDGIWSENIRIFNWMRNRLGRRHRESWEQAQASATPTEPSPWTAPAPIPREVRTGRGRRKKYESYVLAESDEAVAVDPQELVVDGLTVRFGAVTAVRDLSFSVRPGEIVGLIGPNGAGKTTTIDALTGFVSATSGTMTLGGRTLQRMSVDARARGGLARTWQSLELFEDISVLENIVVAAESVHYRWWHGVARLLRPGRPRLYGAAAAAIREFRLEDGLDRLPTDLPYGHRRLAAIARSVALRPSVLLLDEPAAGLTSDESQELGKLLSRLAKAWGMGVLLVEHDVDLVMGFCDRVVVMNFGELVASGEPAEVQSDQRVIDAYLGSDTEDGVDDDPDEPALDAVILETVETVEVEK